MVIEVPRLKDIPTDVKANLQDRLNGVTDILSRVSKLVSEDLEKAVSSAVGQDKDGNVQERWFYLFVCFLLQPIRFLKLVPFLQVLLRIRGLS